MYDPYSYFRDNLSKDEEEAFLAKEEDFYRMMLLRSDLLTKQMWREQDYYQWSVSVTPIRIDDHIYYRRVDNPADALTLYRFPIEELPKWHAYAATNSVGDEDDEFVPK